MNSASPGGTAKPEVTVGLVAGTNATEYAAAQLAALAMVPWAKRFMEEDIPVLWSAAITTEWDAKMISHSISMPMNVLRPQLCLLILIITLANVTNRPLPVPHGQSAIPINITISLLQAVLLTTTGISRAARTAPFGHR